MDKAPDAFRTISEVADDLDLPQHVLRFWETRFQQIKPMKRGGGRRYYRPDDVDLLRGIRHLLYGEGYTIRGVQRILTDHGVKFVQNVWKAGAPQPARAGETIGEDELPPPPLTRPLPGSSKRAEDGPHRRLFGLLPSFLSGERDASSKEPEDERIEPASALRAEETPRPAAAAPEHAVPAPTRALRSEDRLRLEAMLQDLMECRRLLDAAMAET